MTNGVKLIVVGLFAGLAGVYAGKFALEIWFGP